MLGIIDQGFCILELVRDDGGRIVDLAVREVSSSFERQTGLRAVIGRRVSELLPHFARRWIEISTRVSGSGERVVAEDYVPDVDRWYRAHHGRCGGPGSPYVAVVFDDVSARKRAEIALRESEERYKALFARLVSAQEEERRRIARDIHDQLGQQITALRMNLEVLTSRTQPNDEVARQLVRTQRLAEELDRMADALIWDLRPAALDHLGLVAALERLVRQWSERFDVAAEFDAAAIGALRLPPDVEVNLYRIAQEALHNVAKHAEATRVAVCLQRTDGHLVLAIEDDGRGFVVNGQPRDGQGGFGLLNMRERAALVGGSIDIESVPAQGTTVLTRVRL
jgi:signal transduction histidine kinase